MGEPERLRDSTQIVLPAESFQQVDIELEEEFTVTVTEADDRIQIVGSPVEIKAVAGYLARVGITMR